MRLSASLQTIRSLHPHAASHQRCGTPMVSCLCCCFFAKLLSACLSMRWFMTTISSTT